MKPGGAGRWGEEAGDKRRVRKICSVIVDVQGGWERHQVRCGVRWGI